MTKQNNPTGQPDNSASSNPQGRSTDYQKNHRQREANRAINNATFFGPKTVVNPEPRPTAASRSQSRFSAYNTVNGGPKADPKEQQQ